MKKLKKGYVANFETLKKAFDSGDVCLVSAQDSRTKEDRAVICMINRCEGGDIELVPAAKLFDGNPYEELVAPGGDGG